MSTLTISNLNDGTTTVPTTVVTNGSAKVWCNFNGSGTVAIRDSFSVSSVTDQGTGGFHINFASDMGNDDYTTTGYSNGHSADTNFYSALYVALQTGHAPVSSSTSSFTTLVSYQQSVGHRDGAINFVVVHGDLA